jgi:hypothetical protein
VVTQLAIPWPDVDVDVEPITYRMYRATCTSCGHYQTRWLASTHRERCPRCGRFVRWELVAPDDPDQMYTYHEPYV